MFCIAASLLASSLLPFQENGWRIANTLKGKAASPDYGALASKLAASVPVDAWFEDWEGPPAPIEPAALVQKAESGMRKMRAAYNSAPDYAKISGGMAAAGVALAYAAQLDASAAAQATRAVYVTPQLLPKFKEAESAIPDYASIAAAQLALSTMAELDITLRQTLPHVLPSFEDAKSAIPDYGALAAATALLGRRKVDMEAMGDAGLQF